MGIVRYSYPLVLSLLFVNLNAYGGVPEGVEAFGKQRYADARKELADPAEQGDVEAMAMMGEMLMRGWGGGRDELKARDFIQKAQAGGSVRALFTLSNMHLTGNLVSRDEARGIALMKEAAEKGYPAAQNTMGYWLAQGISGYTKDEKAALPWFQAAAAQGNASAMGWLGSYYEEGRGGVAADKIVALDWYKKGAEKGSPNSMQSAGRMYLQGSGVTADGSEALRWFRRAVAAGLLSSYIWIGNAYENGRGGITKNPVLAYAWFAATPSNAPAESIKFANEGKERLQKSLSATELEEANKLAKTVVQSAITATLGEKQASDAATAAAVRRGVYGSGVAVSKMGDILTNEHVVRGCSNIRIQPGAIDVKVVAKDAKNDLALIRVDDVKKAPVPMSFRAGRGLRMGDELLVLGYPLKGILSSNAIVTTGIVNALSGTNDDTTAFQMSATVQPGSSGGPVIDNNGLLVGIVRARLLPTGTVAAQNVNFGINLPTVSNFLDAHSIDYVSAAPGAKSLSAATITSQAQRSTVQVECY